MDVIFNLISYMQLLQKEDRSRWTRTWAFSTYGVLLLRHRLHRCYLTDRQRRCAVYRPKHWRNQIRSNLTMYERPADLSDREVISSIQLDVPSFRLPTVGSPQSCLSDCWC